MNGGAHSRAAHSIKAFQNMVPSPLGFGPMSRNAVDAIIGLAYSRRQRLMVIASRSQIECPELGGGYVEGWSPFELAEYVRARDPESLVMLCRDHGGPWQHPVDLSENDDASVMRRAARSMYADIDAGFDLIHIDTSRERGVQAAFNAALGRLVELYEDVHAYADEKGCEVLFEVGVEQQARDADDPALFGDQVAEMFVELSAKGLPRPVFVVGQTGTHVRGMSNDGHLIDRSASVLHRVRQLSDLCLGLGTYLKAHNGDYLSGDLVRELFNGGVHALNVAPELGVAETRVLLALLKRFKMGVERDRFLELVYVSGAWAKWIDGSASDMDRAVVAGHYVFATPDFREIADRINAACKRQHVSFDELVRVALDRTLNNYAAACLDSREVSR